MPDTPREDCLPTTPPVDELPAGLEPGVKAAANALWRAAGLDTGPRRPHLPDRDRAAIALGLYRRALFAEVRTQSRPTTLADLATTLDTLRAQLVELLTAERLASPDRETLVRVVPADESPCEKTRAWAEETAGTLVEDLPRIRALVQTDLEAALGGDPAVRSRAEVVLAYPGFSAVCTYRLAHQVWLAGGELTARLMTEEAHRKTGIDLHPGASIGPAFFIDHGTGVVVGETAVIGARVRLYQGVTVGARSVGRRAARLHGEKRHPTLEDDVIVYANSTILGGDTVIGAGARIGGNAWVTTSLPPGARLRLDTPPRVVDALVMVPDGQQPDGQTADDQTADDQTADGQTP